MTCGGRQIPVGIELVVHGALVAIVIIVMCFLLDFEENRFIVNAASNTPRSGRVVSMACLVNLRTAFPNSFASLLSHRLSMMLSIVPIPRAYWVFCPSTAHPSRKRALHGDLVADVGREC